MRPLRYPRTTRKPPQSGGKLSARAERQEYTALYPKQIGSTDGLPTTVRDDANRTALAQELNLLQEGNVKDAYPGEGLESYNQRLDNALRLDEQLNERDGARKGKELYLLGYDSKGDGRAIVAMGNPDTAAHTGVLVPGTNTDMNAVPGQVTRISKLQSAAEKTSDGEDVAMISWIGYDAPSAKGDGGIDGVATDGRAHEAGPDLRRFTEGMRASHEGPPSHTTVLGHSYGSTVVGAAASEGAGLGVDDVVVVGSPGMTVDRASDLQMDPEHVWAGGAGDDGVIDAFAGGPLGRDPLRENFGGNNFEVDTHGHSGYWDRNGDKNSDSLANQGRIIAGKSPTEVPKKDSYDSPPPDPIVIG